MPIYKLEFLPSALKEWRKLGATIRNQLAKKLNERLENPHVPSAKLSGLPNCYKIKLRKAGYRLIYRIDDNRIVVIVITVGKREGSGAYDTAARRIDQ